MKPLFLSPVPEDCDPAYRNICARASERASATYARCEELWRLFADLADREFVERFPFELHQRWFEMYLGAALRDAGLDVGATRPGPDFRARVDGRPVYIEAIAPTAGHPHSSDAVKEPVYRDADGNLVAARVPHDQITLRLAHGFREKANKFDKYRRDGRVGGADTCIVAINLREIPHAWADAEEFWMRALYGVGNRFVAIDRSGRATIAGREHRTLLKNAGGAEIDVAPLLRSEHAAIAGVLGSSADVGNFPRLLGDDFTLMPHSAATTPYSTSFVRRGVEVLLHPIDGTEGWGLDRIDYGAHPRRGPESIEIDVDGERVQAEWAVEGRTLSVRIEHHGTDVRIDGGGDPEALARDVTTGMVMALRGRERSTRRE